MALYEYKCKTCGGVFEVMQKFSEDPLTIHEGCGGAVERLVSAAALQFKGTGWYVTDYARKGGNGKTSDGNKESRENKERKDSQEKKESKESAPAKAESAPATSSRKESAPTKT